MLLLIYPYYCFCFTINSIDPVTLILILFHYYYLYCFCITTTTPVSLTLLLHLYPVSFILYPVSVILLLYQWHYYLLCSCITTNIAPVFILQVLPASLAPKTPSKGKEKVAEPYQQVGSFDQFGLAEGSIPPKLGVLQVCQLLGRVPRHTGSSLVRLLSQ